MVDSGLMIEGDALSSDGGRIGKMMHLPAECVEWAEGKAVCLYRSLPVHGSEAD